MRWQWLDKILTVLGTDSPDTYVGISPSGRDADIDEDHDYALRLDRVRDRQKAASDKLKESGKSLLTGYKPPEPYNANRVEVHFHAQGGSTPTEQARARSRQPLIIKGQGRSPTTEANRRSSNR